MRQIYYPRSFFYVSRHGPIELSAKAADRLRCLKARGLLREPLRNGLQAYRRPFKRPYATRKPREYAVQRPGDLVEVDTLDVRPLPNVIIKQITARDVVSRWDVIESLPEGHGQQRPGLSGQPGGPLTLSRESDPGRWGQRVPGGV
jgi:hypothetical protein